ncbi:MAG: SpoIIE family protein phosphatase [Bacteroidota bacterium]
MKKLITLTLIVLICIAKQSSAQTKKMDSLKVELGKAKQDTTRLRIYKALCNECDVKDNLKYGEPAIKILDKLITLAKTDAEKKKRLEQKADAYEVLRLYYDDKGDTAKFLDVQQKRLLIYQEAKDTEAIVASIRVFSNYYKSIGNYHKAIEYAQKGMDISKEMNYKKGIASCLLQTANLYLSQGQTNAGLENNKKALDILYTLKDTNLLAYSLVMTGNIYGEMHDVKTSMDYFNKGLTLYKLNNNKEGWRVTYNCIGLMYQKNNDFTNALLFHEKCLSLSKELGDYSWVRGTLGNMGNIYSMQKDYNKAIQFHLEALAIAKKLKNSIGWSYICLAKDYYNQKNYTKAKLYSDSLKHKEDQDLELLRSRIDSATGNTSGAYEHYKKYITLKEKSTSEDIKKAAIKDKFQSDYDKQKEADKAEQEKKDAIAKAESKKQKLIILFIGIGLLLVLVFAGFVFRSLRIRNKQNKIIVEQKTIVEEKQREILDSIEYALRIQTAILPPQKLVKQYLENSFILYKPKDIVAGDFYWMETLQLDNVPISQLDNEKNGNNRHQQIGTLSNCQIILFAACDCTGHGVPGAMVSVVCHNALNRVVREFKLTQPSEILDKTAEIVIENFSKSEESIKDGMDISLCSLNLETMELQWAGANNPLWLLQNGELMETKADKQPIGMNEDSKPFTNHRFTVNKGDTIYLFTDGFADQFGGDNGEKKLTKKRFKEVVLSLQNQTLPDQGIALDKFINEYRKEVEQIDDILVMGVRV